MTQASSDPIAERPEQVSAQKPSARRRNWRPWLRALHRDAGYFVIGLTIIYAVSGLAVNHIADWDPSFENYERTHQLGGALEGDDQAVALAVRSKLKISEAPADVYRVDDTQLELVFEKRTLHVDTQTGKVLDEGQEPRMFLRAANWLHLNRGKKAWTLVADGYAVLLLFLAFSRLFMIPGRKGLFGRGALIAGVGAAIPIAYVVLSGGP
ncbi:MAG TPA: PepSY-associated TM helix domain-containing protein [Polyangiaceae bacterium]|nr:PepSY-associated TM helix domain-containing protein [Polyangiaceae bacterium]